MRKKHVSSKTTVLFITCRNIRENLLQLRPRTFSTFRALYVTK